jgi:hypothetical protein
MDSIQYQQQNIGCDHYHLSVPCYCLSKRCLQWTQPSQMPPTPLPPTNAFEDGLTEMYLTFDEYYLSNHLPRSSFLPPSIVHRPSSNRPYSSSPRSIFHFDSSHPRRGLDSIGSRPRTADRQDPSSSCESNCFFCRGGAVQEVNIVCVSFPLPS